MAVHGPVSEVHIYSPLYHVSRSLIYLQLRSTFHLQAANIHLQSMHFSSILETLSFVSHVCIIHEDTCMRITHLRVICHTISIFRAK